MLFLVEIEILLPREMPMTERQTLGAAEGGRAKELIKEGVLVNLWRVPGRRANVGIWEVADATKLHEAITSLPLWPWMDVQVTALAEHPNGPGTS